MIKSSFKPFYEILYKSNLKGDLQTNCFPIDLPLFLHWKLATSKINCRDNISKNPPLLTFPCGKYYMTKNWLVSFTNFDTFTSSKLR